MSNFKYERQSLRGLLLTGYKENNACFSPTPSGIEGIIQKSKKQSGPLILTPYSPFNQTAQSVLIELVKKKKIHDHIDPQDVVDVGLSRIARHLGFPVCKRLILTGNKDYYIATVMTPLDADQIEYFPHKKSGNIDVNKILIDNHFLLPRNDFIALTCFNLWAGSGRVKPEHLTCSIFKNNSHLFLGIEQKYFHNQQINNTNSKPHKFDKHVYDKTKLPLQYAWRKILCRLACTVITSCPDDFIYRKMSHGLGKEIELNAAEMATSYLVKRKKFLPCMLSDLEKFINS